MSVEAWILLAAILLVGVGAIVWDTFIAPELRGGIDRWKNTKGRDS